MLTFDAAGKNDSYRESLDKIPMISTIPEPETDAAPDRLGTVKPDATAAAEIFSILKTVSLSARYLNEVSK